jgi:hypothetical protein
MRLALTILLITMGVSALALSGWINASAGMAAGATADAGLQLAALFVLIDLSKVGLLTAATLLLAERARSFAMGLAAAGVVLAVLSFANVSGRVAHLRASEASLVTTQAALAIDAREELARLTSRLTKLDSVAPEASLLAQIEILKTDRRWQSTAACTDATLTESRRFCAEYQARQAELAQSREAQRLERALELLRGTVSERGARAGVVEGDWITGFVTRLSGLGDTLVRDVYALLAALGIELVAALSFPAAVRLALGLPGRATEKAQDGQEHTPAANGAAAPQATPEAVSGSRRPIGDLALFAEACLDSSPGAWIKLRDVYTAYVAWCDKTHHQPLPDIAFRRVFIQLCDAVGYRVASRGGGARLGNVGFRRQAATLIWP